MSLEENKALVRRLYKAGDAKDPAKLEELLVFVIAVLFDVLARIVLFDPGVNMLDIEGHHLAQARDFGL